MRTVTWISSELVTIFLSFISSLGHCVELRFAKQPGLMQYGNFEKRIEDRVLKMPNSLLRKTEAENDVECGIFCIMHPSCLAVNFGPRSDAKVDCELLSFAGTDYKRFLTEKTGFFHMRLENVCRRNPCGRPRLECVPHVTSSKPFTCYCTGNMELPCIKGDGMNCNSLSGQLDNSQITSSSNYPGFEPWKSRPLNGPVSWHAGSTGIGDPWLQYTFTNITMVTGVASQARYKIREYITSYILQYDVNGNLATYKENGMDKVFNSTPPSTNLWQVMKHEIKEPIFTTRLRMIFKTHVVYWAGRFDVYGC